MAKPVLSIYRGEERPPKELPQDKDVAQMAKLWKKRWALFDAEKK